MAYYDDRTDNGSYEEQLYALAEELRTADAVVIGAGAGLSTAAGYAYSGGRMQRYFSDFMEKYGFKDMYSGGFYPYETLEEYWGFWSRNIYVNRYLDPVLPAYDQLFELVKDKDYFVLTTNVDHCFQKAGFDKNRLFYTQGDYGLWQCSVPCHNNTYENEEIVASMVMSQGYAINTDGRLLAPENEDGSVDFSKMKMTVMPELVPYCPVCGKPMTMNLRVDETFVEDNGWHAANERYNDFLDSHKNSKVLFLELGVGLNTPGIIKYNFWRMTDRWVNAKYVCVNLDDTAVPDVIKRRSLCIKHDLREVLDNLAYLKEQEKNDAEASEAAVQEADEVSQDENPVTEELSETEPEE